MAASMRRSFPDEAAQHGGAHAVVKGDGDLVWEQVVEDCFAGQPRQLYDGGRISGENFASARWDLLPERRYMWASVQTVRGCPKHCSFCSVWRTDGQEPRQRGVDRVVREIVELRRLGFRFIALADDNFYPVTFARISRRPNAAPTRRACMNSEEMRQERFELDGTARRAAARHGVLHADHHGGGRRRRVPEGDEERAHSRRLVGVESVTDAGLKDVYKASTCPVTS